MSPRIPFADVTGCYQRARAIEPSAVSRGVLLCRDAKDHQRSRSPRAVVDEGIRFVETEQGRHHLCESAQFRHSLEPDPRR